MVFGSIGGSVGFLLVNLYIFVGPWVICQTLIGWCQCTLVGLSLGWFLVCTVPNWLVVASSMVIGRSLLVGPLALKPIGRSISQCVGRQYPCTSSFVGGSLGVSLGVLVLQLVPQSVGQFFCPIVGWSVRWLDCWTV